MRILAHCLVMVMSNDKIALTRSSHSTLLDCTIESTVKGPLSGYLA